MNWILIVPLITISALFAYRTFIKWRTYNSTLSNIRYWLPRDYARAKQYANYNCVSLCRDSYDTILRAKTFIDFEPQPLLYSLAVVIFGYASKRTIKNTYNETLAGDLVSTYLSNH
jgi:hypothetical protein